MIASSSLLVSTTNMTSGSPPMSRMPPRLFSSLSRSRVSWRTSFLVRPAVSPDSCSSRRLEPLDRVGNGLPVGQHAAEPAMVDEMLARGLRRFRDGVLRLALGADEQHLAAAGDGLLDEVEGAREQRHALRQVDDMHPVPIAENVRLHLGVPAMGLVAEMRSGLEQLLHGDDGGRHWSSPSGFASMEPSHPPCGRHRDVSSICGMPGALAELPHAFKALADRGAPLLTNENIKGTLCRLTGADRGSTGTNQVQFG